MYPYSARNFVREARRAGYPSFIEPILMLQGGAGLLRLTNRQALLHIEAGVDASSDLDAEVGSILKERS